MKRVQEYVETLDVLKLKNSTSTSTATATQIGNQVQEQKKDPNPTEPQSKRTIGNSSSSSSGAVMVTTQWEIFDSLAAPISTATTHNNTMNPTFNWDLI